MYFSHRRPRIDALVHRSAMGRTSRCRQVSLQLQDGEVHLVVWAESSSHEDLDRAGLVVERGLTDVLLCGLETSSVAYIRKTMASRVLVSTAAARSDSRWFAVAVPLEPIAERFGAPASAPKKHPWIGPECGVTWAS